MPDDNPRLPRFKSDRGTITYKITNQPTGVLNMGTAQIAAAFALAFAKWSQVSNFDFAPVTGSEYDIGISFGTPTIADALAETASSASPDGEFHVGTTTMVFDNKRTWTSYAADNAQGGVPLSLGFLTVFRKTAEVFYASDVVTVAVHEIGHALGLSHNTAPDSIMEPDLGTWPTTFSYYMTGRRVPDVDAVALAQRYAPPGGGPPRYPILAPPDGYAIVGSSFIVSNSSSKLPFKDVKYCCWGARGSDPPPLPLMDGYGLNPFLGREGYSYLSLHVLPVDEVGDRAYVVGGGELMPTGDPFVGNIDLTQSDEAAQPAGPTGIGGWVPTSTWGQQSGDFQLCGTFRAWNVRLSTDTSSLWYFILQSHDKGAVPPAGLMAVEKISGDSTYSSGSLYTQFKWGDDSTARKVTAGSARTYGNGNYANGNSFAYMGVK